MSFMRSMYSMSRKVVWVGSLIVVVALIDPRQVRLQMQEVRRGGLVAFAVDVVDGVTVDLGLVGTAERGELIDAFDIDGLRRIGPKLRMAGAVTAGRRYCRR